MPCLARLRGGNIHIARAGKFQLAVAVVFVLVDWAHGRDKTPAVAQRAKAAHDMFEGFGARPQAASQAQQAALLGQRCQHGFKVALGAAGKAHDAHNAVHAHGARLGSEGVQQLLSRGKAGIVGGCAGRSALEFFLFHRVP